MKGDEFACVVSSEETEVFSSETFVSSEETEGMRYGSAERWIRFLVISKYRACIPREVSIADEWKSLGSKKPQLTRLSTISLSFWAVIPGRSRSRRYCTISFHSM